MDKVFTKKLEEVGIEDVPEVGGKNASLGEMIQNLTPKGVNVPGGYVVTAAAYRYFLHETGLQDFIRKNLEGLNTKNLHELSERAKTVRDQIKKTQFPTDLQESIIAVHKEAEKKYGRGADFAVRSSATAEDLPDASFAGEHETYLNIRGVDNVLKAVREAMASLFTDRAISYRVDKGFDHFKVALSVGIQKMVRSDLGCSGVMFTLDTESGFKDIVLINGSWGLGEMIVQGEVTPDEFLIFKKTLGKEKFKPIINKKLGVKNQKMVYSDKTPTKIIATSEKERQSLVLSDEEILKLASWGVEIENHYTKKHGKWTPMDTEWAKDGKSGELYIVQARPETIHSTQDFSKIEEYVRLEDGKEIVRGASVGSKIATGTSRVILDAAEIGQFKKGEILVTTMTDPDWEPIMKIASAIVTDQGGRTSHAAIVSRELGIPCIVGSIEATEKIKTGDRITVDTTGSEGIVFEGNLKFKIDYHDIAKFPHPKTKIMMNIATPDTAFEKSFLPSDGVGLAREEFIIASDIGIHPLALINYHKLPDSVKRKVDLATEGYSDKIQFYVDKLAYGIARIGAAFYPKPVIVRFSDFKTNEYRSLIGGDIYEPSEENPMIGWRGASRYYHPSFAPAFLLELEAIKKVREQMGLDNVMVMVPFCRTVDEGKKVVDLIKKSGLCHSSSNLKVYVMCEIPSNVILAEEFLQVFDGMSIGSNDLTQLTLGIERDGNERVRGISNEKDEAVKKLIAQVIKACKAKGKYVGICGQAPSDYPDFAQFLVDAGIESISLNPDTVIKTTLRIYEEEQKH
ncbi:MAG: phosphoenolpyruvate synthase [Patescibacteria group bacterium]|nr:phosphoenolpyruvate synthase [Patescibacteria group bacterium]